MMSDPKNGEQLLEIGKRGRAAIGEAWERAIDKAEPGMKKVEEGAGKGFEAMETGVVKGYKGIENGTASYPVIRRWKKRSSVPIPRSKTFVDRFLKKDDETVAEAKVRRKGILPKAENETSGDRCNKGNLYSPVLKKSSGGRLAE